MYCSMPGFPVLYHLLEFAQTHVHWVGDGIQPSHTMLSPSPPAFNLSQYQGLLKWISYSHLVAKVLEFQLQHQSSNEYSGLISFRIDLLDLLDSPEFSPTPHIKSINSSVPAFFMVQFSHICTWLLGRPQLLLHQNFVTKVMSLLFNMLSRFVIAFLAKSKHLITSWLQLLSTVVLAHKKIVFHCFHCFPIYLPWSDGTTCHDLSFLNIDF